MKFHCVSIVFVPVSINSSGPNAPRPAGAYISLCLSAQLRRARTPSSGWTMPLSWHKGHTYLNILGLFVFKANHKTSLGHFKTVLLDFFKCWLSGRGFLFWVFFLLRRRLNFIGCFDFPIKSIRKSGLWRSSTWARPSSARIYGRASVKNEMAARGPSSRLIMVGRISIYELRACFR
jgi:hypothetical protein